MSKLAEYRQLEKHLAEQLQALEKMKGDDGLKKEIEFETKLRKLLEHYGFSLKHIVNLLDPQASARGQISDKPAGTRKPRELKVYKNPNTGEVIETKGGNHRVLKEWKAEHGADVVEGWLKK
ncbi:MULTISPECIES: histone-like nucleoid-structuring protein, MvaT/MvaU family [Pseudomonas syringae group]|uniref:H-NS protein n=3 Tax=Pseudomonas syringae group TaxID=136849 RepID=F3GAN5_PSESJ|nr:MULTISPECIES: histone-like nucleoid-structuring protein, MvaT/MvaU family [Pseudomonas syringae group]EGH44135.1 H-NS protein [Pseudomonas syringae pv. pisi str. 1704B]PYD10392.1 transcriptional regulator [Pseudomonas syringae pv. pisi]PYD28220.1 transcriptional regulator [Pseudomonas syringae pv. pisi]PYD29747.1 transcriptional regulator [Pseudomonas syringae pv. pisi]RML58187.1 H-NS protein [Pseudomonas syringae pv. pisi]